MVNPCWAAAVSARGEVDVTVGLSALQAPISTSAAIGANRLVNIFPPIKGDCQGAMWSLLWEAGRRLLEYEVWTTINAMGLHKSHGDDARALLAGISFLE